MIIVGISLMLSMDECINVTRADRAFSRILRLAGFYIDQFDIYSYPDGGIGFEMGKT